MRASELGFLRRIPLGLILPLASIACVGEVDDPVASSELTANSEPSSEVAAADLGTPDDTATDDLESDVPETTDFDVKRYDLKGELDWDAQRLVATIGITLRIVDPSLTSVTLGSAVTNVKRVRLAGGRSLRFVADTANQTLRIDLPNRGDRTSRTVRIEIDYDAVVDGASESGSGLQMMPALAGDPAPSRVAFTVSEPTNAVRWFPCHDVPADRARFSIDMRMPEYEKMIANGNFISDQPAGPEHHRVKYDSGVTLSTYLMSFALGDFEVATARKNAQLPVSIWSRRGHGRDSRQVFSETFRGIDLYESLFGHYPFKTYAAVFVPFGWGMENATTSLLGERLGDYRSNIGVTTGLHELAHQWFGDSVTNESWDDVWFKEGMAVLLEMESLRVYLDESKKQTLGGDRFNAMKSGDAIRDVERDPTNKGSGPYPRAAWLLTQIRSLIGEDVFWSTLRQVLREHRNGAIGTDAFVDAFAPSLGLDATERVRRAVDAKRLPRLRVAPTSSGKGAFLTLHDPDGALVAPFRLRWVAEDGTSREQVLELNKRVEVTPSKSGEFLVIDPDDVHPDASLFSAEHGADSAKAYKAAVVPLLVPKGDRAIKQWLDVGGIHQLAVLQKAWPNVAPENFRDFLNGLDAEGAKALSIQWACEKASNPRRDESVRSDWSDVLTQTLTEPPYAMGLSYLGAKRYNACSKVVALEELFAEEWTKLEEKPESPAISEARIVYLSRFRLPPERAFSVWSNLATKAHSLNVREQAAARLALDAPLAPPDESPQWRAFFASLLSASEDDSVLYSAIDGILATQGPSEADNAASVSGLNAVLHDPIDYWDGDVHSYAVCAAYKLLDDSSSWQKFVDGLHDANLKPVIQSLVDDPSGCTNILP